MGKRLSIVMIVAIAAVCVMMLLAPVALATSDGGGTVGSQSQAGTSGGTTSGTPATGAPAIALAVIGSGLIGAGYFVRRKSK